MLGSLHCGSLFSEILALRLWLLVVLNSNICLLITVILLQSQEVCILIASMYLARTGKCPKRESSHNCMVCFNVSSFYLVLDTSSSGCLGYTLMSSNNSYCVLYIQICLCSLCELYSSSLVCLGYAFVHSNHCFCFLYDIVVFLGKRYCLIPTIPSKSEVDF